MRLPFSHRGTPIARRHPGRRVRKDAPAGALRATRMASHRRACAGTGQIALTPTRVLTMTKKRHHTSECVSQRPASPALIETGKAPDPHFTGSVSRSSGNTTVRVSIPVNIQFKRIENYEDGRLTSIEYNWCAELEGHPVASHGISDPPVRSEAAALRRARAAVRNRFNRSHDQLNRQS